MNMETQKQWENLCSQCGKCCYSKYDLGIMILVDPDKPCQYLDSNKKCSIYLQRQSINPDCLLIEDVIMKNGYLVEECGYKQLNPAHKSPIFPKNNKEFLEHLETAEKELVSLGYRIDTKAIKLLKRRSV